MVLTPYKGNIYPTVALTVS